MVHIMVGVSCRLKTNFDSTIAGSASISTDIRYVKNRPPTIDETASFTFSAMTRQTIDFRRTTKNDLRIGMLHKQCVVVTYS